MGLDIYMLCDGVREEGEWGYVRFSGTNYEFRSYVTSVFDVPEDFESCDPIFQPNWVKAYDYLLLWLRLNQPDNDWVPDCLNLLRMCHEAIHWGPERHQIEWWG